MNAIEYNRGQCYPESLWRAIQSEIGAGVDGIPGRETSRALASWQREHGLVGDGKCGAATIEAMFDSAPRAPYDIDALRDAMPGEYWIDISHHQDDEDTSRDDIDWDLVASHVDGVVIKATEGRTHLDPLFVSGAECALACDLPLEIYHMARPVWKRRVTDPVPQVDNIRRALDLIGADVRVWFDLETGYLRELPAPDRRPWVARAIEYMDRVGMDFGLYLSHWGAEMLGAEFDCESWFAYYNPHAMRPRTAGWKRWGMHQLTDRGRVPGISGNVDINRRAPR